ncbi:MAG: hypothetical protein ACJ73D_08160, partial [Pyrinomonadaceae bacterium]
MRDLRSSLFLFLVIGGSLCTVAQGQSGGGYSESKPYQPRVQIPKTLDKLDERKSFIAGAAVPASA